MRKPKLVIVSSFPLTEPVLLNRVAPYTRLFLAELFEVVLVCPKDTGSNDLLPEGAVLKDVETDPNTPKSFIKRAIHEINNVRLLFKEAEQQRADIYLLTIPSMFLAFLIPLHLRREKVFLDVRDLTWEYLSDASLVQRLSKKLFRILFKTSLKFTQGVSVTNATEMSYILKIWHGKRQPVLVSNGISQEQFDKLSKVRTSTNNQTSVVYIGNVGLAQYLDTFVEAAKLLPDVCFTIVGAGTDYDRISSLVTFSGLNNVKLIGRVPWDQVKNYYDTADVLYAQLTPDFASAIPSKLYEYLATGKYVIYGGQAQAAEKLAEFGNNQVILPCDAMALAEAISNVQAYPDKQGLSLDNRERIKKHYIREDAAKALIDEIKQLLKG